MMMKKILVFTLIFIQGLSLAKPPALANEGNSCFVNAVLQCLRVMPELNNGVTARCNTYIDDSVARDYVYFLKRVQEEQNKAFRPATLSCKCWNLLKNRYNTQQDAGELLLTLIDRFSGTDLKQKGPTFDGTNTLINDLTLLMFPHTESTVSYDVPVFDTREKGSSVTPSVSAGLELPIEPGDHTIFQCLNHYFSLGSISYKTPIYNVDTTATKCLKLSQPSEYLVLNVKRTFLSKDGTLQKHQEPLNFPLHGLNIGHFAKVPKSSINYDLIGVIMHRGQPLSGHYTAYVKEGTQWWYCNDTHITQINNMGDIGERGFGEDLAFVPSVFIYKLAPQAITSSSSSK